MRRKIYTRTGDLGQTALFAGGRVPKDDARVAAYGAVDELNAVLGCARALGLSTETAARVERVQGQLFTLGADLATPPDAQSANVLRLPPSAVVWLEGDIDAMDAELPPLANFILPGGALAAAHIHTARTVARRTERAIVALARIEAENERALNTAILPYINRLSDWLFTLARWENMRQGIAETIWSAEEARR